jgi:hypothetical protein
MTMSIRLTLTVLVALSAMPAWADHEAADAHAQATTQTITLDGNDVRPSNATMSHTDVLSFVNYSTHPVQVRFTEPADLEKKIRCGLIHEKGSAAPSAAWALFAWQDGALVGDVPPGRFASVCSLEPGTYGFTVTIVGHNSRGDARGTVLPAKGQLVVK